MRSALLCAALALAACGQASPPSARPFGPPAPPVIPSYLPAAAAAPNRRDRVDAAIERALAAVRELRAINDAGGEGR